MLGIKHHISKITRGQKSGLTFLFLFVFLSFLLVPQPAQAFLGITEDIWGVLHASLDALDFVDNTVLKYLTTFVILMLLSEALVVVAAVLLQWAIYLPVYVDNSLVQAGWNFTSGLVNIFFILALVVIALFWIFRSETFGMKKALTRLIIIALLINFSLLLVKIFVDIGDIFLQSLLVSFGEPDMVSWAIEPLKDNIASVIALVVAIPSAYLLIALVPGINALAAVGIGTWLFFDLLGVGGGLLLNGMVLTILNIIMGMIFLAYGFLFLARVVVIWLLAIFAPLAFFAYIFPKTEKYFWEWLKSLLNWALLGIVTLFLMGLGLKLFLIITGPEFPSQWRDVSTIEAQGGNIPPYFFNYIFLIIYLIIALQVAKKFTPKGAEIAWKAGSLAFGGGMKLASMGGKALAYRAAIKRSETKQKGADRMAADMEADKKPTLGERLQTGIWTRKPKLESVKETAAMAEIKTKGLKSKLIEEKREKILSKAPKDPTDRADYLENELLQEGKRGVLRNREKIAALVNLEADAGKIGPIGEGFVDEAIKSGANAKKILDRRPDLAASAGKTIEEVMNGMDAETFRKQTQKDAFKNKDVVKQLLADETKFFEITQRGSAEKKKMIKNTFKENAKYLSPRKLSPQQQVAATKKLKKMFKGDPKWQT